MVERSPNLSTKTVTQDGFPNHSAQFNYTTSTHTDGNCISHYLDNAYLRQKDTDLWKLRTINNPGLREKAPHTHALVLTCRAASLAELNLEPSEKGFDGRKG